MRQVDFGPGRANLSTVGYTLLLGDWVTEYAARTTVGVSPDLGGGNYFADIALPAGITVIIWWDTGEAAPAEAFEVVEAGATVPVLVGGSSTVPYATTSQLAGFLGIVEALLPSDAARLIQRASEAVLYATRYIADDPPDTAEETALMFATLAQSEYWISNGEIDKQQGIKSKSFGKTSITYSGDNKGGELGGLCDRSRRFLFLAGLLSRAVITR